MIKNKKSVKSGKKVICPCCHKERNIDESTPLLNIEDALRQNDLTPWWASKDWTIKEAKTGNLQWACNSCLKRGLAIAAKPSLETFCDHPPYLAYFDVSLRCEDCGNEFAFSAQEQQYWYEELKFWVQSRPEQCAQCRKARRERNQLMQRLERTIRELDANDARQLMRVAELYFQLDNTKKAQEFLRRAKNRTVDSEEQRRLQQQIERLSSNVKEERE